MIVGKRVGQVKVYLTNQLQQQRSPEKQQIYARMLQWHLFTWKMGYKPKNDIHVDPLL
jgi:hypothetical protein